jgi:uncharacterized membrane protein
LSLKPHNKRNQTADLLKGFAVIFMIQVHIMEQFAQQGIFDGVMGKISLFFGGPPCAPVFMTVMGYFLFSPDKPISYYLKRGLVLFAGGILLNTGRSVNLFMHIYNGSNNSDPCFYIFGVDILLLAGLSVIIIGLFQLLFKRKIIFYLLLAVVIIVVTPYVTLPASENSFSSYLAAFTGSLSGWSYFPLFPWLSYILIGYAFRLASEEYKLSEKFSVSHSLVFSLPLLLAAGITINYAIGIAHDLYGENGYYHHDILFFAWMMIFMTGYIMLASLIEEYSGKSWLVRFVKWAGKNVTVFYVFQWLIIGNIATEIYKTQNKYDIIFWFIIIIILASILTYIWEKIKNYYLY